MVLKKIAKGTRVGS